MSSYVYKFVGDTTNIIYIGKTDNIDNRMKQHFSSRGHLSSACYDSVVKVFYSVLPTKCDADILETFLINKYSPKYNTDKIFYQNINRNKYQLQEPEWIQYEFAEAVEPISEEYQLLAVLKNNISILNNSEYLQSICSVIAEFTDEISKLIKVNELAMRYLQVDLSRVKDEDEPQDYSSVIFGNLWLNVLDKVDLPKAQELFRAVPDMKYLYEIPEYTPEVLESAKMVFEKK